MPDFEDTRPQAPLEGEAAEDLNPTASLMEPPTTLEDTPTSTSTAAAAASLPLNRPEPPPTAEDTPSSSLALAANLVPTAPPPSTFVPTGNLPPFLPPEREVVSEWPQRLLLLVVVGLATCMAFSIVILAGLMGMQDEWHMLSTQAVEKTSAAVSTQYVLAERDFQSGNYAMAEIRYQAIQEYQNVEERLNAVQTLMADTATPTPSPTLAATPTSPQATSQPTPLPSPTGPDPDALFGYAESAMNAMLYEEAILWYDALRQVAPNYRRQEVQQNLIRALTLQGEAYIRGQNTDGEDRLAQGVQMINRAGELGYSGTLLYEADFVARYLAARAYLEGGLSDQARPILQQLCDENCGWGYRGVTVELLLLQAGGQP